MNDDMKTTRIYFGKGSVVMDEIGHWVSDGLEDETIAAIVYWTGTHRHCSYVLDNGTADKGELAVGLIRCSGWDSKNCVKAE